LIILVDIAILFADMNALDLRNSTVANSDIGRLTSLALNAAFQG
jgi:hypothetical protein